MCSLGIIQVFKFKGLVSVFYLIFVVKGFELFLHLLSKDFLKNLSSSTKQTLSQVRFLIRKIQVI